MTATATASPCPVRPVHHTDLFLPTFEVRRRTAAVEIVVPVYNEEAVLEQSIERLTAYLDDRFPLPWLVTIADNASTDGTWPAACRLAGTIPGVQARRLTQKGRGRALRAAWTDSPAPVVAYMDVDLSTDLDGLLPLVAPLLSGHSDVAIGSRLAAGSRVARGPKREAISRTYNLLLRTALHSRFSDAQCGFKALRREVAAALLPLIEDEGWFFDTELLVLAEHNGLRIHEVPVDWVDDPDSRVDIAKTATDDLRGVGRLLGRFARNEGWVDTDALGVPRAVPDALGGQLVRFASVGLVSSLVFALLFAALIGPLGPLGASLIALALCGVANTAAHRSMTFPSGGRRPRRNPLAAGIALGACAVLVNLVALAGAGAAGISTTAGLLVVLTGANAAFGAVRFVLLRRILGGHGAPETAREG